MSRALALLALLAALVTACTIQLDLPGGGDDDDGPRSGFLPCPGCTDAGPGNDPDGYPDAGYDWWDSDGGPSHSDASCNNPDTGDAGYQGTPDAGADW